MAMAIIADATCIGNGFVHPSRYIVSAGFDLRDKILKLWIMGLMAQAPFKQRFLRIQVSLAPEDVRMQQAMDFCFFSPAELQQAHFVCTSISCKGLADAWVKDVYTPWTGSSSCQKSIQREYVQHATFSAHLKISYVLFFFREGKKQHELMLRRGCQCWAVK